MPYKESRTQPAVVPNRTLEQFSVKVKCNNSRFGRGPKRFTYHVEHKRSAPCLQTDLLPLQRYCQHDGQLKPEITALVIIVLLTVAKITLTLPVISLKRYYLATKLIKRQKYSNKASFSMTSLWHFYLLWQYPVDKIHCYLYCRQ